MAMSAHQSMAKCVWCGFNNDEVKKKQWTISRKSTKCANDQNPQRPNWIFHSFAFTGNINAISSWSKGDVWIDFENMK